MVHHYQKLFWSSFLFLLSFWASAQVQVSFPVSRAVLQRNNSNEATFRIMGFYTSAVSRIEARLNLRDGGGTATDWRTIQNNPSGGVFAGDFTGTGGWYNLEVRGMNGDQQVGNSYVVERVGIGEVFIIAGQSNAQGIHQNAPNPGNDQVNCVNYLYNGYPADPPTPVFTKLDNFLGFHIAPFGLGSWCWGQLGDLLVKRLGVPIMFFNAAFEGTLVENWRQSAPEGGIAYSRYITGLPYNPRQPYINLKVSLQYYANMLGMRAVLWHQGEGDNQFKTSTASYVSDLQFVINQSRQDFGRNMPWMVARASYGDFYGSYAGVINAQNQVISTTANVFAGPNTDGIQIPRSRPPRYDETGVHFDFNGLIDVANAWSNSMNDAFFQTATPISPAASPTVDVACAGNNNLTLTVSGYPSVQWESGETSSSITKGTGTYRAKVKDGLGNTLFTSQVQVSSAPVASVVSGGPAAICIGSSLALTTNYGSNVTWINQQTGTTVATSQVFNATTAGTYSVRYRDVSGCDFTSNAIALTVNPLPATPTVSNSRPLVFCQGDNTTLQASTDNVRYNWNSGQTDKTITTGTGGAYFLTVTDQNGCTSAQSNTVTVTANPVPDKPVITSNGPTTFCGDQNVTLTAPQNTAYQWSSGQTSQSITTNQSGSFTVRTTNQFGCTSVQSDPTNVIVNPLPQVPTISAAGTTTFCQGNSVTLNANSPVGVIWSSGQTSKSIQVNTSGTYGAQSRDQNGCQSAYSSFITVQVNALPATPTILASPSPIICEGDRATLRVDGNYTVFWSTGDSTQRIQTGTPGTYTARVRDTNGCVSAQAGSIIVETRPIPSPPTINAIGTYTLQAISSTNSDLFRWRRGTDSLTAQTAIIKANVSGSYTARSSIVYSQTLVCYSNPSTPLVFTVDPNNRGLSIYPNPNPDKILTLETQENLTNATVTLYTLTGQMIMTTNVPVFDERKRLVLTGIAAGQYILRVSSGDFDVSKRILLGL